MNGNGDAHDVEIYEDEGDLRAQAIMLTDRTLTAIGGLETEDPTKVGEIVARFYPHAACGSRRE